MSKPIEPTKFVSLNAALDALSDADVKPLLEGAAEDIDTAESVETMEDFKANVADALAHLKKAVRAMEVLLARC